MSYDNPVWEVNGSVLVVRVDRSGDLISYDDPVGEVSGPGPSYQRGYWSGRQ